MAGVCHQYHEDDNYTCGRNDKHKETELSSIAECSLVWYVEAMTNQEFGSPREAFDMCPTHPLGRALRLLGDVPTLMIVCILLHGTKRFGEVRTAMGEVSPKTISQRLKILEELGVVSRQAYAEIPPRVEYSLTEKGCALHDIIVAIQRFGDQHLADTPAMLPSAAEAGRA
jgi:DNA-binding HxlR family transcriptional regulator